MILIKKGYLTLSSGLFWMLQNVCFLEQRGENSSPGFQPDFREFQILLLEKDHKDDPDNVLTLKKGLSELEK